MRQITLRQIPEHVDAVIRRMSKKQKKSINKTIIAILEEALGFIESKNKKRDLSKLAGTWDKLQSDEFVQNTKSFDRIDKEIWE